MTINRRKMLGLIGGGTILAATAGIGGFLSTRVPHKALKPWSHAGEYSEPRKRALSYAILAPTPHNRQPWLVDLRDDDKITLYVDTKKMLPHTDPFNRQITIGLGCFLELLRMAAAEDGYLAKIDGFPRGFNQDQLDDRPVAVISFTKDASVKKDQLFSQVLKRQSLKEPYDMTREISDDSLAMLRGLQQKNVLIGTSNLPEDIQQLRQLTHQALAIEIATPRTHKESVDLFRIGKAEINANPDGIDLGGPLLDSLAIIGAFTRTASLDTKSANYQQGIDKVMANVDTAMGYVWLITDGNTRFDQLNVGRDWLRVNLNTTRMGLGTQPLSQALQEYPEMAEKYTQIHKILGAEGKIVQMFARLGYAERAAQSPRWPIEAKII